MFQRAGAMAPEQGPSVFPKVDALIAALEAQGLVRRSYRPANARAFVKWKSLETCALIIDMRHFNRAFAHKVGLSACRAWRSWLCCSDRYLVAPGRPPSTWQTVICPYASRRYSKRQSVWPHEEAHIPLSGFFLGGTRPPSLSNTWCRMCWGPRTSTRSSSSMWMTF